MPTSVVLDLGCCPAGSRPARTVARAGGKATSLAAAAPDHPGEAAADPHGWSGQVARLLGLHPEAVAAGVPVPLAHHLNTWSRVRDETDADRWDLVGVRVVPAEAAALVEAPDLLLRVLDARLGTLAPAVGTDPAAASAVAELLGLRPGLMVARALAEAAAAVGHPHQHAGCDRPGALALPTVDRDDPAGPAVPAVTVRPDGPGFVVRVGVPAGAVPSLARDGRHLALEVAGQRRTLRLAAALARCEVRAATVVADRLEVHLEPDPDAWR